MDLDLSRALHDAAETGTAHRPQIAVAPVLTRIRRRRTVRHAVEGTVGVAAAGAVAVGAVQVTAMRDAGRLEPVAPATAGPTPTPSTTPSPAPAPSVPPLGEWPVVRTSGPFGCGLPVPDVADPGGDADLHFAPTVTVGDQAADAEAPAVSAQPGERLTVDALLTNGTAWDLAAAAGPVEVWFVQDGSTVAGRLPVDGAPASGARYALAPGGAVSGDRPSGTPVACTPDGADDVPLAPGEYALHVVQELRGADGAAVLVTGAAVPVTIAEPVEPVEPVDPVDPHPDLAELVLSPAGLGPLAVGVPPASNPGAAMIEWDPDRCEGSGSPEPGRWVASGYPDDVVDGQPRDAFFVDADDDAVRWIDVLGPTIRTAEGLGVGTTLEDLRRTYPALEGPFDGPLSRVWWLTGDTGTLVFETQGDADGLQPAGTPESVILVRVLATGIDPRFATANSDQIAGGCL